MPVAFNEQSLDCAVLEEDEAEAAATHFGTNQGWYVTFPPTYMIHLTQLPEMRLAPLHLVTGICCRIPVAVVL